MEYLHWLILLSACFALAERLRPARRGQRVARPQIWNDLGYLLINGHFYAVWAGGLLGAVTLWSRKGLGALSLLPENGILDERPWWLQFFVFLVLSDLLQWCVHRTLHAVPFLWQFHKVHHSVQRMDWAANFRFHWVELVVYRSLLYVPLLWLGGDPGPLFAVAVFATAWGHFNHANLDLGLGRLGYVLNSPAMHLWHHDASDEGGTAKNFGIVFSLWDFLFGTVWWPRRRAPLRIGYPTDAEMPADLPRQMLFPLWRRRSRDAQG